MVGGHSFYLDREAKFGGRTTPEYRSKSLASYLRGALVAMVKCSHEHYFKALYYWLCSGEGGMAPCDVLPEYNEIEHRTVEHNLVVLFNSVVPCIAT
jgi:hypothetical protein